MRGGLVADQRDGDGRLGLTETAGTWPGTLGLMTTMLPFHIGVVGGDVLGDPEQVVTPFSQPLVGLSIPTFHYLREEPVVLERHRGRFLFPLPGCCPRGEVPATSSLDSRRRAATRKTEGRRWEGNTEDFESACGLASEARVDIDILLRTPARSKAPSSPELSS
jgi:hypothetical protein